MKNVMTRAWEIYRTLEGDRLAKLSYALKQAWSEFKGGLNKMLNKVFTELEKLDLYKHNPIFAKEAKEEAAERFNAGWEAIEDGTVVNYKGNFVMTKKGDSLEVKEMVRNQWRVDCGKLIGDVKRIVETRTVTDDKKEALTAQVIIVRFYTIPKY
jgi:hypothetical protein